MDFHPGRHKLSYVPQVNTNGKKVGSMFGNVPYIQEVSVNWQRTRHEREGCSVFGGVMNALHYHMYCTCCNIMTQQLTLTATLRIGERFTDFRGWPLCNWIGRSIVP